MSERAYYRSIRRIGVEQAPQPTAGPAYRRAPIRPGENVDGPPHAMCAVCAQVPMKKAKPPAPKVTIVPIDADGPALARLVAAQGGRCIRCGHICAEMLVYALRCSR